MARSSYLINAPNTKGGGATTEDHSHSILYYTKTQSDSRYLQVGADLSTYLDRSNHTGTQTSSTISDFSPAVQTAIDGMNINANTLNGIGSASFLRSDTSDVASGSITFADGWYFTGGTKGLRLTGNSSYFGTNADARIFRAVDGNGTAGFVDGGIVFEGYTSSDSLSKEWLVMRDSTFTWQGNTIWHSANDGAGSGLDSDLLDGVHGSGYLRSNATGIATGRIQFKHSGAEEIGATASGGGALEVYQPSSGSDAFIGFNVGSDHAAYFGLAGDINDLAFGGWSKGANQYRIWHEGNDGSGSGLDADRLDGQEGSYYSTSTHTHIDGLAKSWSVPNSSGTYGGQWAKVAVYTISNRYRDYNSSYQILTRGSGLSYFIGGVLDVRVKQQNALGDVPFLDLIYTSRDISKVNADDFKLVTTTNSLESTVVELWVRNDQTWNIIDGYKFADSSSGGVATYLIETGTYATSTPTGTGAETAGRAASITVDRARIGTVIPETASLEALVIRGAPGQTADLAQWQNSSGTALSSISTSGNFNGGIDLATGKILNNNTSNEYDKIRVWNSGNFTIGMKSDQTLGFLNDYAMTFTMSNTVTRGFLWRDASDIASDGAMSLTTDGRLYVKSTIAVGGSTANIVWHAGNDGAGSGLDADTVDGQHASAFAGSGHNHSDTYASNLHTHDNIYAPSSHTHNYLALSGGTMTGLLTLKANPTSALHAATKQYVDSSTSAHSHDATYVNQSDHTKALHDALNINADTVDGQHANAFATSGHNHSASYVSKTGDTMSGVLTINNGSIYPKTPAKTVDQPPEDYTNGFTMFQIGQADPLDPWPGGGGFANVLTFSEGPHRTYQVFAAKTSGEVFSRVRNDASPTSWSTWARQWTDQNDGSGSGLDADLLDGQHGSYYATAAHDHSSQISSNDIDTIEKVTQAEYNALTPDPNTMYAIVG